MCCLQAALAAMRHPGASGEDPAGPESRPQPQSSASNNGDTLMKQRNAPTLSVFVLSSLLKVVMMPASSVSSLSSAIPSAAASCSQMLCHAVSNLLEDTGDSHTLSNSGSCVEAVVTPTKRATTICLLASMQRSCTSEAMAVDLPTPETPCSSRGLRVHM